MTPLIRVLGVLGLCRVDFGKPTQVQGPYSVALPLCVLGVLGLCTRARRRIYFNGAANDTRNPYASTSKPNTPNTLNTDSFNPLNLLSFKCVGFVLSWLNMCWVLICGGYCR